MKLTINGKPKEITAANISEVVGQFCTNQKNIITEVNGAIVPSAQWNSTPVKDGDTIELVSFVGGG